MSSERRKYSRKEVDSRVKIFHPVIGSFTTNTINISNGGILIPVDQHAHKIKKNDEVKVVFLSSSNVAVIFNMNVIRKNKAGIGMKLVSCEKAGKVFAVSDLREALR